MKLVSRPYPINKEPKRVILTAVLFGLFIGIFLYVLRPFGLHQLNERLLPVCFGFSGITILIMLFVNGLMVWLFPRFFKEETWTVGKEILWALLHILLIGFFNALYTAKIGFSDLSLRGILIFESYAFIVGFFPITISVLLKEVNLSRKFQQESEKISSELPQQRESLSTDNPIITFPSDTKNDDFTTNVFNLLYLEAAENYVIFWSTDSHQPKTIVRITMKHCEELLSAHPPFLRIHKSYIANLNQVDRVSGNAQGYKIHFNNLTTTLPVSRKMNDSLRSALSFRP
jgi:hypothetical protein